MDNYGLVTFAYICIEIETMEPSKHTGDIVTWRARDHLRAVVFDSGVHPLNHVNSHPYL